MKAEEAIMYGCCLK